MEKHQEQKLSLKAAIERKENHLLRIKILSLGPKKTGKTCIIKRYCEHRFVQKYIPTVGVDYGVKQVKIDVSRDTNQSGDRIADRLSNLTSPHLRNASSSPTSGINIKVDIFDLSGNDEYADVIDEFFQNVNGAFLVYDVLQRESFNDMSKWLSILKDIMKRDCASSSKNIPIVLCANKVDRGVTRNVTKKEGMTFATTNGFIYYETSCKSGDNIEEMLEYLFSAATIRLLYT